MACVGRSYFHRDALLSVLFTYMLLGFLGLIFFNTKYLNPIYQALYDFEFTDFYYTLFDEPSKTIDPDIVLVNIGNKDRKAIANMVGVLAEYHPSVIGLDVCFIEQKDLATDSILKAALHGSTPLVLASQLMYLHDTTTVPEIQRTHPFFGVQRKEGYGSFLGQANRTVRYFQPYIQPKPDSLLYAFSTKMAKEHKPEAYAQLMQRGGRAEYINYRHTHFISIDADSVYVGHPGLEIIKGKVVLMGYLGDEDKPDRLEDLHLTPFNKSFGGHSVPDMYGVEIHAHILKMIFSGKYVFEPDKWLLRLLAFLLTLLHIYPFLYYFVKKHIWFHIVAKSMQLLSSGIIFIICMYLFHYFDIRMEPAYLIYAVILSVDALYFLDGIAKYLHRKYALESYFMESH
jgi:CHASE2 domain-containing sensor protein